VVLFSKTAQTRDARPASIQTIVNLSGYGRGAPQARTSAVRFTDSFGYFRVAGHECEPTRASLAAAGQRRTGRGGLNIKGLAWDPAYRGRSCSARAPRTPESIHGRCAFPVDARRARGQKAGRLGARRSCRAPCTTIKPRSQWANPATISYGDEAGNPERFLISAFGRSASTGGRTVSALRVEPGSDKVQLLDGSHSHRSMKSRGGRSSHYLHRAGRK